MSLFIPLLPRCPSLPATNRQRWSSCSPAHRTFSKVVLRATTFSHNMSSNSKTTSEYRGKRRVIIITGYVCIGKSYFCSNLNTRKDHKFGTIVDLDSSNYSRDRFPQNYLDDIRKTADSLADRGGIILVSTFPHVGTTLKQEGYYVAQVLPHNDPEIKSEWLRRLEHREKDGKASRLYQLVNQFWDEWSDEMETRDVSKSIRVSSNQFLSNIIDEIYQDFEQSQ